MVDKAYAVIGSNFGDEGKGLVTDYLSASDPKNTIVCRYNGGAQAGHTVETPDGRRHIFSHFGAGSLAGASTYLSRFFISNPLNFEVERKALSNLCDIPDIVVDARSLLTTPYDVAINRAIENRRGVDRHGSVGLGINETVTRCLTYGRGTYVGDIYHSNLRDKLDRIRDNYFPMRLSSLGIDPNEVKVDENVIDLYLESCRSFTDHTGMVGSERTALSGFSTVVFEGAQGLLLDEFHNYFPYVTRSRTGAPNIIDICRTVGISNIETIYVTRPYITRHGAGPFPHYDPSLKYDDLTNIPNDWQETMRFGRIDLNEWTNEVLTDFSSFFNSFKDNCSLTVAMTWGDVKEFNAVSILDDMKRNTSADRSIIFRGKTRNSFGIS